jgi:uncharacterized membrane protein
LVAPSQEQLSWELSPSQDCGIIEIRSGSEWASHGLNDIDTETSIYMPKETAKMTHQSIKTPDQIGLERLIFFSDAVIAIAITLLSLDIRLPAVEGPITNARLAQLLLEIYPKYLAYVISFLVIGVSWIGHHRKFRIIQRYDSRLLMLNLLFLMVIAFIPFPTSLVSEYGNRTATIFYALVMVVAAVIMELMWAYASHNNRLIDPHLDKDRRRREMIGPLLVAAVFLLSIGLACFNVGWARLSWVLVALAQMIYRSKPGQI